MSEQNKQSESTHKHSAFNLSVWALKHQQMMFFIILVLAIGGMYCYNQLGRAENPSFTIRTMTIQTNWPGATAEQVANQVTEVIEKKLSQTPGIRYVNSKSFAGTSVIYVNINDPVPPSELPGLWKKVRNEVQDIESTLPQGIQGPYFNDEYGDVYGNIYALVSENDAYTISDLGDIAANRLRNAFILLPNISKVQTIGVPNNKIYIDLNNQKLATLGINPVQVYDELKNQNAMTAAGMTYTASNNIYLHANGLFQSLDEIRNIGININNQVFKLGDIATVRGGYDEPLQNKFYYNGKYCVGVQISMVDGGNILQLGADLDKLVKEMNSSLPDGVKLYNVCDQSSVVIEAIGGFTTTLLLAILIILVINFMSLGVRPGIVTALSIPLVLCATFIGMYIIGQGLNSITLGALIISLGLLVDDAIIAMEMMESKLSEGYTKFDAASAAFEITALSMFTGTMVTVCGFMPVAFSPGQASQFTFGIFAVVGLALTISWFSSVTIIPTLGYHIMKESVGHHKQESKLMATFNNKFRAFLVWALHHRALVVGCTIVVFIIVLLMSPLVSKEFFPPSTRRELIIDLTLPEGSSLAASDKTMQHLMSLMDDFKKSDNPLAKKIDHYSTYVGMSAPRFVLTYNTTAADTNFSEMILTMTDYESRTDMQKYFRDHFVSQLPEAQVRTWVISTGPPSSYPVMIRVSGADMDKVQDFASQVKGYYLKHPGINPTQIKLDWYEKSKVLEMNLDQNRIRQLGINPQDLQLNLQSYLTGISTTSYYFLDRQAQVVMRQQANAPSMDDINYLKNVQIYTPQGYMPLSQIAKLDYKAEYGLINRRDLVPCVEVQSDINPGYTGNDVESQILKNMQPLIDKLPFGYSIKADGDLENSQRTAAFMSATYPFIALAIMILLMLQLQHIGKMILVLVTAPLGLIGVNLALIILHFPMGFVADLGVIALAGMIMRNSVILIHCIHENVLEGQTHYDAIINACLMRFRPIMLTASAAICGMIPLFSDLFWGPMAVAIAGGLISATILTLIFLPALYALCFRVYPTK